jgi:hydroxymethylpyrimidine kinase/phosphomethylpyrimidine kinase
MSRPEIPVALTIAGSDSGGGAGIQADLKTFAALGVHGTCAITCITAQNPVQVLAIDSCRPQLIEKQIAAVFSEMPPGAIKTGMLYSRWNIAAVIRALKRCHRPLIVDPVMVSTSGRRLLERSAMSLLQRELVPRASLVTPNLHEAEILSGLKIRSLEDMKEAARKIHERFGCAVLVKGGHLDNSKEAIDVFFDGKQAAVLKARRVRGIRTHGTGCTYSAAITAHLARGEELLEAIRLAKRFVSRSLIGGRRVGRHFVFGLG